MNYTIHFPENYTKLPLVLDVPWLEELRKPGLRQCTGVLCNGTGECCLGVLSRLQGRLIENDDGTYVDGEDSYASEELLSDDNPMTDFFDDMGEFPLGVRITLEKDPEVSKKSLSCCNDAGLTFTQIADIIEAVWGVTYAPVQPTQDDSK